MSERVVYESFCKIGRKLDRSRIRAKQDLRQVARKYLRDEDSPILEVGVNKAKAHMHDTAVELSRHVAHCRDGCKRAPAVKQAPVVLDASSMRAPWASMPQVPPADVIAARLRAGEPLEEIAAQYGRAPGTLKWRLNNRGWMATGQPANPTDGRAAPPAPITYQPPTPMFFLDGVCAQTDPEEFFPEKGGSTRPAKAVCASCTVRDECLQFALDNGIRHGIWGGLADRERRKLERQQAAS